MSYVSRGQKIALLSKLEAERRKSNTSHVQNWLSTNKLDSALMQTATRTTRLNSRILSPFDEACLWIQREADMPSLEKKKIDDDTGFGVFTTSAVKKGAFVLDYSGNIISEEEGMQISDQTYLYYFQFGTEQYCLDASSNDRLGRFVNDAKARSLACNCYAKSLVIEGKPRIILFASKNIVEGQEIRYDYGGGSALPWRKTSKTNVDRGVQNTYDESCSSSCAGSDVVPPSQSSVSIDEPLRNVFVKPLMVAAETVNSGQSSPALTSRPIPSSSTGGNHEVSGHDSAQSVDCDVSNATAIISVDMVDQSSLEVTGGNRQASGHNSSQSVDCDVSNATAIISVDMVDQSSLEVTGGNHQLSGHDSSQSVDCDVSNAAAIISVDMVDQSSLEVTGGYHEENGHIDGDSHNQHGTAVSVADIVLLIDNSGLQISLSDLVLMPWQQPLQQVSCHEVAGHVVGHVHEDFDQATSNECDDDDQKERSMETDAVFLLDNNVRAVSGSDLVLMPNEDMTLREAEESVYEEPDDEIMPGNAEELEDDDYYVILDSIDDESQSINLENSALAADENLGKALSEDEKSVFVNVCKAKGGKHDNDKHLCCFFCRKILKQKMQRHMTSVHKMEPDVMRIMSKPKTEQELSFTSLVHRGNFNHNVEVLEKGVGELIVCRRPSTITKADEYLPCVHCLGFYLSKDLCAHSGKCQFNLTVSVSAAATEGKNKGGKNVLGEARMFLAGALHQDFVEMSDSFKSEIFDTMRIDKWSKYVGTDSLIIKYGATLHRRHGKNRCHDISQKMRLLSRLVLQVKQGKYAGQFQNLDSLISGAGFDCVLETTEDLCQLEENESGRPLFKNPTLGLSLGHILVKIAEIKKGMGIRNGIRSFVDDADAFLNLHKADWTNCISSASLATFKRRKYNNPDVLPLTNDLIKLKKYQELMITTLTSSLNTAPTYALWRQLLEVVYSRVVVFNKRRCGETAKLLLSAYVRRPTWQESANDEIVNTLQPLEKQLLKRMDMIHLPGKGVGARRVPLLLTPDVVTAMDALLAHRAKSCIPETNLYFFATPSDNGFINGWQAMRNVSEAAKLDRPDLVHSTRLRKYIATVSQVAGLTKGELKWLANHMGHELNIHETVYRLQDSTIELAKVSRLLMAVDSGRIQEFAGKTLDQIQLADLPPESDDEREQPESTDCAASEPGPRDHGAKSEALLRKRKELGPPSSLTPVPSHLELNQPSPSNIEPAQRVPSHTEPEASRVQPELMSIQPVPGSDNREVRKLQSKKMKRTHVARKADDSDDSDGDESYCPPSKTKQTSFDFSSSEEEERKTPQYKKSSVRMRWSAEELGLITAAFGGLCKPPCNEAIVELQQKNPIFQKRTIAQIKSRAWHLINTGR